MAWLTNWNRRKSKIINGLSTDSTNIMVNLTVFKGPGTDTVDTIYCNDNVKSDFSDIRFTKLDGTTQLRYRILSSNPNISANITVEIDFLPASQPTQIYIYYDNPVAPDAQTPTLDPYSIITSNNLNDAVPTIPTPFGFTCSPRVNNTYTYTIPSTFDEAWVAIRGLTTYSAITNDVNGVMADDLYVLNINGSLAFNVALPGTSNTCTPSVTRCIPSGPICGKSVNITSILSPLKGQSVNFNVQLIDSQGTNFFATSGAVYFISAPVPVINLGAWGTEEVAAQNIIAISIVPSTTTCTEPCNLTVDITWRNDGNVTGTFEPTIIVDSGRTAMTTESLTPGATVTITFLVTGLVRGSHTICSDPDTLPCISINVLAPANIISTSITPSATTCREPCDITIDVTWTNTGEVPGNFEPAILTNGVRTALPNVTLDPLQTVTRTFTLTGLTQGSYTICADPDTGTACAIVTVEKVTEAGMGAILLVGGLALGFLLFAGRKKEKEKEKVM